MTIDRGKLRRRIEAAENGFVVFAKGTALEMLDALDRADRLYREVAITRAVGAAGKNHR